MILKYFRDFVDFKVFFCFSVKGSGHGVVQQSEQRLFEGLICILIAIVDVMRTVERHAESGADSHSTEVVKVMVQQLEDSKCGGILHFMSRLVLQGQQRRSGSGDGENRGRALDSATLKLLNGAMAFLNGTL